MPLNYPYSHLPTQ